MCVPIKLFRINAGQLASAVVGGGEAYAKCILLLQKDAKMLGSTKRKCRVGSDTLCVSHYEPQVSH